MALAGKIALSVFPALLAAGGAYMLYATRAGRARADAIDGTPERPVGELTAGEGYVALSGRARASTDERVPATIAGTDGVAVQTIVEEYVGTSPGDARRSDWQALYGDADAVPFAVADDTGTIPVESPDGDAEGVTVDPTVVEVEPGEDPPANVARWIAETDGVERDPDTRRAYKQGVIEDGESVSALGEPVERDGGLVLTGDDRPDEFVVSDLSEDELSDEAGYGLAGYVVGAILLAVGVVPLAVLWLA
ncbi:GIDE domain-containing protein [Halorubellus sp. PRR65]|uniref:GIDE domain-containing protein n=1 Tax=Halorubellus sp. PRR65 TaxID=3098148 RepID=UPI002B25FEA4|nr:GIDE domain-containing protein [Halorubellus sp. PRR65]